MSTLANDVCSGQKKAAWEAAKYGDKKGGDKTCSSEIIIGRKFPFA
jgi:hypothetical protein